MRYPEEKSRPSQKAYYALPEYSCLSEKYRKVRIIEKHIKTIVKDLRVFTREPRIFHEFEPPLSEEDLEEGGLFTTTHP